MNRNFDPDAFPPDGERLIDEFEEPRAGTTPSTVGSAAEQPVRDQLEQVLPKGVGVGESFVIDSYGRTSRQQDVILYERRPCGIEGCAHFMDTPPPYTGGKTPSHRAWARRQPHATRSSAMENRKAVCENPRRRFSLSVRIVEGERRR